MGLFNRNKNKNLFDKNIEPKCVYCEHGRTARSEGKILCPRCGIVDKDYSCKKFKYSPFLRIPERDTTEPESSPTVSVQSEKAPAQNPEPLPTITQPEKKPEPEIVKAEPGISATDTVPLFNNKTVSFEKKSTIKNEASHDEKVPAVSNINNKPSDNSEIIAKLNTVEKTTVSSIENYVQRKEINLPETSRISVASIENKPLKRNSEEYLKNIPIKTVSEFESRKRTVHQIPPEIKKPSVNDMG